MHPALVEKWAQGDSLLHKRDPRAKLAALMVFLIVLATAHRELPMFGSGLLVLLLIALRLARVPVAAAAARAGVVLPFAAVFAVVTWLAGDPARGAELLIKSYLSALAVLAVVSTTPLPALLRGLEGLGIPQFLLMVAQFLYRYLFVISEESRSMNRAAAARAGERRPWSLGGQRFRAAAGALSVLFARSYKRADDVHRAMMARGFQGRLLLVDTPRFERTDLLFLMTSSLTPLLLRIAVEKALA